MSPCSRTCVWLSMRPGRQVACARSMTRAPAGASACAPTDLMRWFDHHGHVLAARPAVDQPAAAQTVADGWAPADKGDEDGGSESGDRRSMGGSLTPDASPAGHAWRHESPGRSQGAPGGAACADLVSRRSSPSWRHAAVALRVASTSTIIGPQAEKEIALLSPSRISVLPLVRTSRPATAQVGRADRLIEPRTRCPVAGLGVGLGWASGWGWGWSRPGLGEGSPRLPSSP
jgi:hypothetical protein